MASATHRWSFLLVLLFLATTTFLFFFLTTRQPKPREAPAQERQAAPLITSINPSRGPKEAAITIVEYGDFQCQACRDLSISVEALREQYPEQIRVIWKDFPNKDLHPESIQAAIAARCALEQGAFWGYHDLLFTQSNFLSESTYLAIARTLKLNEESFLTCLKTQEPLARIDYDFQEGLRLAITATPTIFIGSERYIGALSNDALQNILQPLLKR